MKEILFVIAAVGIVLYGYFLMNKLDKFLDENRRAIEKESEIKEPSCIMLTEDVSDEELIEEVRRFQSKHGEIRMILYDSSDTEWPEITEYQSNRKR